jgi:hypothetical protein
VKQDKIEYLFVNGIVIPAVFVGMFFVFIVTITLMPITWLVNEWDIFFGNKYRGV